MFCWGIWYLIRFTFGNSVVPVSMTDRFRAMENADRFIRKKGQKGPITQKAFAEYFSAAASQLSEIQKWTQVYNNFGNVMDPVCSLCLSFV
jgi:hypothetical protein